MSEIEKTTKVAIRAAKLHYPRLHEPETRYDDDGEKKTTWSCVLMIRTDDKATCDMITEAMRAAVPKEHVQDIKDKKLEVGMPFEPPKNDNADLKGYKILKTRTGYEPVMVGPDNKNATSAHLYPGAIVQAHVTFNSYMSKNDDGDDRLVIACNLKGIRHLKDGKHLSTTMSADDMFGDDMAIDNVETAGMYE